MPLYDLQTALVSMVAAQPSRCAPGSHVWRRLDKLELTGSEREWLAQLADSPGFLLTCEIQRWWRKMRLELTAPLTLAALGRIDDATLVDDYFHAVPCSSLFFVPEALLFLDFVISSARPEPVGAIARFERAVLIAAETDHSLTGFVAAELLLPEQRLRRHPKAAIVEFPTPPVALLSALLLKEPLPPPDGIRHPVLVAPGLSRWWRPGTRKEWRMFVRCEDSTSVESLLREVDGSRRTLLALTEAGALVASTCSP